MTRISIGGVPGHVLKLATDEALIARTPIFYGKSRNVGRLSARLVARRRAELTLTTVVAGTKG